MNGRALVAGGSIGGLFAAVLLHTHGWEVDVFERSDVELAGRGAGIVTHAELIDILRQCNVSTDALGVAVEKRVAYDRDGRAIRAIDMPQVVTSWDRIHSLLRAAVPEGRYHLGRQATGYSETENGVTVHFSDGGSATGDLLVGADGFRSSIRGQMFPEVQPVYSGYVVWRALVDEAALPKTLRDEVFRHFGFFLATGNQVVGYPIAGPGNDLSPGRRRYNFVWYTPAEGNELCEMLTDAAGVRHDISIPPPLIRDEVIEAMHRKAEAALARPFVEMLRLSERPFFTPIYDHASPAMARGRVALSGDAAFVARPHVGMGVTKAAGDALALARCLEGTGSIREKLAEFSRQRTVRSHAAFARGRTLGSYIYEKPEHGDNLDGASNPNIEIIMDQTAVAI